MDTQATIDLRNVAVVVPCFRCADSISLVIEQIPASIASIICVDDCSDDDLADVLRHLAKEDPRISVISHDKNRGVGGAMVSGYRCAIANDAEVIVKIDADGQMNPAFIESFVAPIRLGEADYVKGNRFFDIEKVRTMPVVRLIGNAGLTLFSRLSTGYWELSDPTNGYTAISAKVAALLPLEKLHQRYFFESDILFRLYSIDAVVAEQPLETRYGKEVSQLSPLHSLLTFPFLHMRNFMKRIFYSYFLRNFDVASLNLLAGLSLVTFGAIFGALSWIESAHSGEPATAGTVMLSVTPTLVGFQLLLSFLQHDVARQPHSPIHLRIERRTVLTTRETQVLDQS